MKNGGYILQLVSLAQDDSESHRILVREGSGSLLFCNKNRFSALKAENLPYLLPITYYLLPIHHCFLLTQAQTRRYKDDNTVLFPQ